MGANVHPVARWSLVGALALAVLMVVYYLTGGDGTVAFGFAVIGLATAAFIYLIYSRLNAVQRTGNMALLMVILIALLLPFFFLAQAKASDDAQKAQYQKQLTYAAGLFVTYCSTCHGLQGQGLSGAQLNNNKDLEKINVTSIIANGILDSSQNPPATYLMPAWSDQNGGPFNQDDINAMSAFVQSWDPVLRTKNNVPNLGPAANGVDPNNGFNYIYALLNPTQQATYTAQRNPPIADAAIDLTKQATVTIPIVADPNLTNNATWNFLYPVPGGKPTRTIKVKSGTVITWQNSSGIAHSIYSGTPPNNNSNVFAISIINDKTTSAPVTMPTVTTETTITYYCSFHPAMRATIIVEP